MELGIKKGSKERQKKLFVFPGNIEPEILEIGASQVSYARTAEFGQLVLDCEEKMLRLLGNEGGRIIPYTASGTAAMEAVVSNMVSVNDRVLVLSGGVFGDRWAELVGRFSYKQLEVLQIGEFPNYAEIVEKIKVGGYDIVFMQHHETSTGVLYDVERIGKSCQFSGALFVVDAIGSFLADPFLMDQMQIDVAVTSSQKGLNLPPGLAFVALNKRALDHPFQKRGLYFDFDKNLRSLERGQSLYSPAAVLLKQLKKRLDGITQAEETIARVAQKARFFRELLEKSGRELATYQVSHCLTSFDVECSSLDLCKALDEEGFVVMPSNRESQIRVSHLGMTSELDYKALYERICFLEKSIQK